MRRKLALLLTISLIALATLSACGGPAAPASAAPGASGAAPSEPVKTVDYPKKAISVILPYSAGGDTDVAARTIAKYLPDYLGESVVVSNVTGSSGGVAINQVAESPNDGYTILMHHTAMLNGTMLGLTDKGYADFEPVGSAIQTTSQVWCVLSDSDITAIQDVVDRCKATPESVTFATLYGNFTHLEAVAFEESAGVTMKKVDAGAASEHLAALLGGHVDVISIQYNLIADYVTSGKIRCLAVLSAERNPALPDIPTMSEQGVAMDFSKVYFFLAPKGTDPEVIDVFASGLEQVTQNPDFQAEVAALYYVNEYYSPEKTAEYLAETTAYFEQYKEFVSGSAY